MSDWDWARAMPAGLAKLAAGKNLDGTDRWIAKPHLMLLNEEAMLLVSGKGDYQGLAEEMSVRSGKSEFTSKYLPAWFLGRFPNKRVGLASYEADFAATWGRKTRDILEEWGPSIFGVRVRQDTRAANRWDVERWNGKRWVFEDGGMFTAGVGGPFIGKGFHLIIVDDPFKNAKEANSQVYRDNVWEWFVSGPVTRLEPGGVIIVIQSRWHEDDLIGRLKKKQAAGETGINWRVLTLPAIAGEDDLIGREPGEALFPERYPVEKLLNIKKDIGEYWFSAQYQQRPQPAEGGLFKRQHFRYFSVEGDLVKLHREIDRVDHYKISDCWTFQTIDPTASDKTSADYFVISTWLVTPRMDILLWDQFRDQVEGAEQKKLIASSFHRNNPQVQGVEVKSMGLTLYQELRNMGLPVYALKADTDKFTRAIPASARMEAHTIFFREGAPWLDDLESELLYFPRGANDDQVDTLAYGAILLTDLMVMQEAEAIVEYDDGVQISAI